MKHLTPDIFKCYSLLWCYIQLAAMFDRWNTRPMIFSDAIHYFDERESSFFSIGYGHHVVFMLLQGITVTINTTVVV